MLNFSIKFEGILSEKLNLAVKCNSVQLAIGSVPMSQNWTQVIVYLIGSAFPLLIRSLFELYVTKLRDSYSTAAFSSKAAFHTITYDRYLCDGMCLGMRTLVGAASRLSPIPNMRAFL
jgi:hypothetical protein